MASQLKMPYIILINDMHASGTDERSAASVASID
jgi:hypothetical protein